MRVLTPDEENKAFELMLDGADYPKVAKALGFASKWTFYQFRVKHPEFSKALHAAHVAGCEDIEGRIMRVNEDYPDPQQARVALESYRTALGYRNPQRYNPKLDVNVTQTLDIHGSIQRMEARLSEAYKDVTPRVALEQTKNPNDFNDLW